MRIRNPDGSEAGACGNATRCVAHLVAAETGRPRVTVRTVSGDLPAEALPDGRWRVDMGPARLGWQDVPLAREMDTLHLPIARGPIGDPAACSMGNPHATFFVPDLSRLRLDTFGPSLERDPLFPERANIGFAQVLAPDRLRLLVWERGAGADARLRLRRLRRAGERAPPRLHRPPRHRDAPRRRPPDRMARGRRPRADDRPRRHRLHRRGRPGRALRRMSVEVLTFGCRLNAFESEAMRGLAERAGHRGAVLVNTCAVTAEAEKQARQAIRAAHRRNPAAPILVTGCASQIAPAAWASLPGVARVVPQRRQAPPRSLGADAPPRRHRHRMAADRAPRRTWSPTSPAAPAPSCRSRTAATTAAPSA